MDDVTPPVLDDFPEGLGMDQAQEPRPPELEYPDSQIIMYSAFRDQVHSPRSVLYPSCGYDASPGKVFSDVTFVDKEMGNSGCIDALVRAGYRAIKADITDYVPHEDHDLLLLENPAIDSWRATQHLKPGAWIISNNYHGNATEMWGEPEKYELWGTIDTIEDENAPGGRIAVVSRDLTDLFVSVKDAEEFRACRPEHFEFTRGFVEHMASMGYMSVDKDAPFEAKWERYRELMQEDMPSRRVAALYIFRMK